MKFLGLMITVKTQFTIFVRLSYLPNPSQTGNLKSKLSFSFLKIVLASLIPLLFYITYNHLALSMKVSTGIMIETELNL